MLKSEVVLADPHRTTIYLDPKIHRALKIKAAETSCSVSALISEAVRVLLAEDLDDLRAIEERRDEPSRHFADFLAELEADGLL
jgi:hypothetical protein